MRVPKAWRIVATNTLFLVPRVCPTHLSACVYVYTVFLEGANHHRYARLITVMRRFNYRFHDLVPPDAKTRAGCPGAGVARQVVWLGRCFCQRRNFESRHLIEVHGSAFAQGIDREDGKQFAIAASK